MLKYSIIIILTCLLKAGYSVPASTDMISEDTLHDILPLVNGKVSYIRTVDCGTVTLAELFRRARIWMLQSGPEDKILVADKETGDLVSHKTVVITIPRSENNAGGIYSVSYTLVIECANRKYRSSLNHMELLQNGTLIPIESFNLKSEQETKDFYKALDKKLAIVLSDLEQNTKNYTPF